ncbi:hypothetical protein FE697_001405 [Mumia zhuanghuii]|uniref:HNH endonuclease n=2 Tax=Mumia TaxID=1546255 RepID=A0ABW1QFQ5_9ACTN|nr:MULTISPECIES: hypothetical protein [Mumia]KAA1424613.1 hypothetical protein FE697_001405 [Mumia zhuanghuii]
MFEIGCVDGVIRTRASHRSADVLNVGRTQRLATDRHRDFGRTDLDDLLGLCPRCHHLLHAGKLHAERDSDTGEVVLRKRLGSGSAHGRSSSAGSVGC